MTNNDILRRLRYALDLPDSAMLEICRLGGQQLERTQLSALLKKEEEDGSAQCPAPILMAFLDGLILQKRGQRKGQTQAPEPTSAITNNTILKKLRIALELQEDDLLAILSLSGADITRAKLNALFRKEGHRNFKECGNQFLRSFLTGLALYLRKQPPMATTTPA